ncbi:NADH:flavin oxidoreductase/NADH oxidase [Bordetella genomosp. 13]|uniref:NADH:flavin oxidoreductase/NADH oxidase n=1 Tax=Bordetella genomosp. 13 TaxID=463040 RepID=UPI0011A7EDFE|nr:NADH:flavin oxidoreductase/NADH oxidase [Bordetella genomosp. 13]
MASILFSALRLRGVEFKNRIGVAPMCQYCSRDGLADSWHMVHLGSRAVGGAGMVMFEASAVSPEARITQADLGIWNDEQAAALRPIAAFIADQGAVPVIQLAHAGRKGSTQVPWEGRRAVPIEQGGWPVQASSAVPFNDEYPLPESMSQADIANVADLFARAARRSLAAGMRGVELHMGHGYLMHQFLSPLANRRTDRYGGAFENRVRAPLEVAAAVREAWPAELPLMVRLSATDWLEGGWDLPQSVELARRMKALGVDLVDCSSGSILPASRGDAAPGYQVPFAARIRREAGVPTAAVGLITQANQAEDILRQGQADMVFLARELLRDPYWPLRAAAALDAPTAWPVQYARAVQGGR